MYTLHLFGMQIYAQFFKTKEMEKFEIYSDARTSANPDPDSDNTDN